MANNGNMSKKLNHRRLTRQQEAFCVFVAQGTPPTEAVEQVNTTTTADYTMNQDNNPRKCTCCSSALEETTATYTIAKVDAGACRAVAPGPSQ